MTNRPDGASEDPIEACRAGRIAPEIACARLLLAGVAPDMVAARLDAAARVDPRFVPFAASGSRWIRLRAMLDAAGLDHAATVTPDAIGAMFDRANALSPEASVALYSLGDPETLARATDELVAWLDDRHLLGPDADLLDLGCGIGRVARAIAGRCRSVLGLDVSHAMIATARARSGAIGNLRFETVGGHDLAALADGSVDCVLAVDSMPYLVASGGADRHVADAARILRPDGALAILNLSYDPDPTADPARAARWAASLPFTVEQAGDAPFRLWDGRAFILRRGS